VITVLSFFQLVSKAVSGIQFLQVGGDRQLSFDVLGDMNMNNMFETLL
jgi:hypothetical protein